MQMCIRWDAEMQIWKLHCERRSSAQTAMVFLIHLNQQQTNSKKTQTFVSHHQQVLWDVQLQQHDQTFSVFLFSLTCPTCSSFRKTKPAHWLSHAKMSESFESDAEEEGGIENKWHIDTLGWRGSLIGWEQFSNLVGRSEVHSNRHYQISLNSRCCLKGYTWTEAKKKQVFPYKPVPNLSKIWRCWAS